MFTEKLKDDFGILRAEIIDLNILAHCFVRKMNRFGFLFQKSTRHHYFEELTACRYMENGLILHLTKLDDDANSSKLSFRAALKLLKKYSVDAKKMDSLNALLATFKKDLNNLRDNHRNIRVAHLNKHEEMQLDQFLDFDKAIYPLIKQANEIGDLLWGEKLVWGFKLGTWEGILDFRKLNEDLKIDFTSQKGW